MEDPDERYRNPYGKNPNSFQLTQPAQDHFMGGRARGKLFPKDYSQIEDKYNEPLPADKDLPTESILMDQEIPTGEGANDNRFVSHEDIIPYNKPDPIGPHNMQGRVLNKDVYQNLLNKRRKNQIKRI